MVEFGIVALGERGVGRVTWDDAHVWRVSLSKKFLREGVKRL